MKKIAAGLMAVCLAVCSGCSGDAGSIKGIEPVYPKAVEEDDYDAQAVWREENAIDESFYQALEQFTARSGAMVLNGSENTAYSPVSLYMTLALASEGAAGRNREQFMEVLGVLDTEDTYLKQQCGNLMRQFHQYQYPYLKCGLSNSLWLKEGIGWKKAFTDTAASDYYAYLYQTDFQEPFAGKQMGEWVSTHTGGVMEPHFEISKEQLLTILNAVYFKAEWMDKFDKESVEDGIFHTTGQGDAACSFLTRTRNPYGYLRGQGFVRSGLPFKGNASIFFVLPDEGKRIEDMVSDPKLLEEMLFASDSGAAKVNFKIPKFSFGSELELTETLKSLGLTEAFSESADFSQMADGMAYINGVRQQSHMSLDENGVEAASFTQIDYAGAAMPKEEIVDIVLERPFLYGIYCQDVLVFVGICQNPADGLQ